MLAARQAARAVELGQDSQARRQILEFLTLTEYNLDGKLDMDRELINIAVA